MLMETVLNIITNTCSAAASGNAFLDIFLGAVFAPGLLQLVITIHCSAAASGCSSVHIHVRHACVFVREVPCTLIFAFPPDTVTKRVT